MANKQIDLYVAQADVKSAVVTGNTAERSIDSKLTLLISELASTSASLVSLESKLNDLISKLESVIVILQGFNAIFSQAPSAPVVLVDVGSQQIQTEVD